MDQNFRSTNYRRRPGHRRQKPQRLNRHGFPIDDRRSEYPVPTFIQVEDIQEKEMLRRKSLRVD